MNYGPAVLQYRPNDRWSWTHYVKLDPPHWTEFTVTNRLIDGGGTGKYPDGLIATPEQQQAFAARLAACWNHCLNMTDKELGL